jgi:BolA protein
MNINDLISIIKNKISSDILCENIKVEDKSFLHKNHPGNDENKFHIKLSIESKELKVMSKINSNKKIYKILSEEMKSSIHSLQILIL